jgi:hypothetical protein
MEPTLTPAKRQAAKKAGALVRASHREDRRVAHDFDEAAAAGEIGV